jgi:hypothetical protein
MQQVLHGAVEELLGIIDMRHGRAMSAEPAFQDKAIRQVHRPAMIIPLHGHPNLGGRSVQHLINPNV